VLLLIYKNLAAIKGARFLPFLHKKKELLELTIEYNKLKIIDIINI